jgi:hypothetical protein
VTYLAVDPGKVTGVATWDGNTPGPLTQELKPYEYVQFLENFLFTAAWPLRVVLEGFTIRANTHKLSQRDIGWPLELIGATRAACWRVLGRNHEVQLQSAITVKTFVTDKKLRRVSWYVPGDHARDATRHLYYYLHQRGVALLPRSA